jgi:hypothetical protein
MKNKTSIVLFWGLSVAILLSVAEMDACAKEIRLGPVRLKPSIRFEEKYEDNIFLEATDKKSDFITTITPIMSLDLPFGDYRASLAYALNAVKFTEHPRQDSYNHEVVAFLGLNFTKLKFTAENDFQDTKEIADTELSRRIHRSRNDVKANAGTDLPRINVDLGFRNIFDDYKETAWQHEDRYENIFLVKGSYRVLPKTSLFLEYNLGGVRYYTSYNPNADYHQGFIGIEGRLTARSASVIKVGYQARNYKRSGVADFYGLVTTASISERFTTRDIAKLAFLRSAVESTYGVNNYYVANRLITEYSHEFTKRFSGALSGAYQLNRYPKETTEGNETGKRKDTLWSAGILLNYKFRKWVSLELGYRYEGRESNFGVFDFGDNVSTLSVTAEF